MKSNNYYVKLTGKLDKLNTQLNNLLAFSFTWPGVELAQFKGFSFLKALSVVSGLSVLKEVISVSLMKSLKYKQLTINPSYLKGDLHIHGPYSDGEMTLDELLLTADKKLDFIAITDHNTDEAYAPARQIIKERGLKLKLLNGIEVSSMHEGRMVHLLAYATKPFKSGHYKVREHGRVKDCPIKPLQSVAQTIKDLRDVGAEYVIPAHPFHWSKGLRGDLVKFNFDGVEFYNSTVIGNRGNHLAMKNGNGNQWRKDVHRKRTGVGGSDAHYPILIGSTCTLIKCERDEESIMNELTLGEPIITHLMPIGQRIYLTIKQYDFSIIDYLVNKIKGEDIAGSKIKLVD